MLVVVVAILVEIIIQIMRIEGVKTNGLHENAVVMQIYVNESR